MHGEQEDDIIERSRHWFGLVWFGLLGGGSEEAMKKADEEAKEEDMNIVLTVYMHCEGCARKVRRCLKGFQGVESVETDCASHRVVVRGEKADPLQVLGRLQTKTHRRVELISAPNPQPRQQPHIITVVLKVHMHCHACAQQIKTTIHRMKGVQSVEADLKCSEVRVKGAIDPAALLQYVHRRTGKHAAIIVNQHPELLIIKQQAPALEMININNSHQLLDEKKDDAGADEKCNKKAVLADVLQETEVQEKSGVNKVEEQEQEVEEEKKEETVKVVKNEFYNNNCFSPQRYMIMEMYPYPPPPMIAQQQIGYPPPPLPAFDAYLPPVIPHAYPPQMFSDENPNACSLM